MTQAIHAALTPVKFTIGSRTLVSAKRRLVTVAFGLNDNLAGRTVDLPPLTNNADGYRFLSVPPTQMQALREGLSGFTFGQADRFQRHYIDMRSGFDAYMAQFSGKTRSTLGRKSRKLADISGGALDFRIYASSAEIAEFFDHAMPLSAVTYQQRLLNAGLPSGDSARAEMLALAASNRVRAFLLFIDGQAAAYLYLPIEGPEDARTVIYAYLGFHPDFAHLSVGTVLQMEALRHLFAENRYSYFDFTEGEGAHKALFGTDAVEGVSVIALKPTLANRALLLGQNAFNGVVERASALADQLGVKAQLRSVLKR